MARFANGWVAISRRIFLEDEQANEFFGDLPLVGVWVLLISWANVRQTKIKAGVKDMPVPRGCVVTSQDQIGRQLGLGRIAVRRCLGYLVETKRISLAASRRGTVITILNYDQYQKTGLADIQDTSQQAANDQPTTSQQAANDQPVIEQRDRETGGQRDRVGGEGKRKPAAVAAQRQAKSTATWEAYRGAYRLVHGADPLPNAQTRSLLCLFIDRVGADDAPEVAEHYVTNERDAYTFKNRHPLEQLVKLWQKYHTDWKTKTKITTASAKTGERDDSNKRAIDTFLANKHAARAGGTPP